MSIPRIFVVLVFALASAAVAAQPPAWAVYVYMGGDYTDVQVPSLDDFEEMERVGSGPDLKIVVQRDGARGAGMRRYLVERAPAGPIARRPYSRPIESYPESDSGSARVLEGFLDWSLPRYPAQRRALVLAGHSWGWKGIIQDQQHHSIIPVPDVVRAVRAAQKRHGVGAFDMVVVDACVAGSVEVAHELSSIANVAVFTPLEMPYPGFPWDRVLARLAADPAQDAHALARTMVSELVHSYGPHGVNQSGTFAPVALSAVDLTKIAPLTDAMRRLSASLVRAGETTESLERLARLSGPDRLLDIHELSQHLAARDGDIGAAARDVRAALAYPDPAADGAHRELVLERDRPFSIDVEIPVDARRAPRPGPITLDDNGGHSAHGRPGRPGLLRELLRINPELPLDHIESPRATRQGTRVAMTFTLRSEPSNGRHRIAVRPGLGTSSGCTWRAGAETGALAWRERHVLTAFPSASPLIAEGHSTGTYPCHGLYVCFESKIEPDHIVTGPEDYRRLTFDEATHWSTFLFPTP